MSTFDKRTHFAVPVYAHKVAGFAERRAEILAWILELARGEQGISASNRGGFHSTRDLHRRDAPPARFLRDAILAFARDAVADHYGRPVDLALTELWANVSPEHAWHTPHEHFPSHWSGVLYVAAEHTATRGDPADRRGKLELASPIPLARAFGLPASVVYAPEDGKALLFPGALVHLVHPHASPEPRVCVSFNLDVTARG